MKFNFKKISAIATSVLMVGMTAGIAAAANYPAPFVQSGTANVAVVYGTGQGVSSLDILAAGNIQSNLQSQLGSSSTSTTSSSVSGGDNVALDTSSRKLYFGDGINAARSSITASEMPNILKDGTFTDLSGTQYDYTQTVTLGSAANQFSTSGGDLDDPALLLQVGTNAGALYNYSLSFTKNINVSDSTNVQGQKINILGVDYVIGASSTNSTLYLYGSGETVVVNGGESSTVNIAGTDHTVELVTTNSATAGTIKVDGVQRSVTEGNSYAFPGDINVYVKDIINPQFAGDLRQAELIVGANTLKLVNGQSVKEGADATSIKGTSATITAAGDGIISGFKISVGMPRSKEDHIAVGESFTDPVFGGLKMTFSGAVPTLVSSTERGKIVVDTDNNQYSYVTFTSARASTSGEQKLTYVYDNNTASTAVQPLLAHQTISANNKGHIHVLEGENALENDWIVINQGDAGTILEVTDMSIDTSTSGTVTFEDAITGSSQTLTLTNSSNVYSKSGVNFFGGNGYTIKMNGAGTNVNVTWSSAGTKTLFPRIKLADGGWITFLTSTSVVNGTSVIFPDGLTTIATSGSTVSNTTTSISNNGIIWNVTSGTTNPTIDSIANPSCNFNSTLGPAILFIEQKKWDDGSYGNYVCVPLKTTGTTEIAIDRAILNGTNSGFTSLNSDTYKSQAVDQYGTLVTDEQRTNENGVATISYPKSQMYLDYVFSSESATVTPGTTTTGGATQLGEIIVKDSEVASVSSKNLIVVGGSCINSAAAKVLGVSSKTCGSAFTQTTGVGSGQFLIQSVADAYTTGKVALVVAGYDAADTQNGATYLTTQVVDTSADKKYVGTTSTSAQLIVS